MATKNKKTKKSKKLSDRSSVLMFSSIMVLAAIIVFGGLVARDQFQKQDKTENQSSDINTAVLYEDEKRDTDKNEEPDEGDAIYDEKDVYDAERSQTDIEHSENGLKIPNIVLSINQNDQVYIFSARITNFLEENGQCKYILTNGDRIESRTVNVLPDPKTTVCEAIVINKSDLGAGNWTAKVQYKSYDAEGESEIQSF